MLPFSKSTPHNIKVTFYAMEENNGNSQANCKVYVDGTLVGQSAFNGIDREYKTTNVTVYNKTLE